MSLTERAKEISAFATTNGLNQYKVIPFGVKNAPATFQRRIHSLLQDLERCKTYNDDIITNSKTWVENCQIKREFVDILAKANFTVNLKYSEFYHANEDHLGHKVGQGYVTPIWLLK